MKNSKLKLEDFFSDSLDRNQTTAIKGGIGGTGSGLPPNPEGGPGGPLGTGGTDSGPVKPKEESIPPSPTS